MKIGREQRILTLEGGGDEVGRDDGDGRFTLDGEFWDQLRTAFASAIGGRIGTVVTDAQATALADLIEARLADLSWQLHLHLWGDEGGEVIRSLVRFLRAGGFVCET